MNHDRYEPNNDLWYAPIVLIVGLALAFAGLVWAFNQAAKADEAETYIIRIVALKNGKPAVIQEYRPNDAKNEFKTKEECEVLLNDREFIRLVLVPALWTMAAQYKDVEIQVPECIAASVEAKQIEELKSQVRQQKGEEL